MDERPGGNGGGRLLLFVGIGGIALIGLVIYVTLSMAGGGGGRAVFPAAVAPKPTPAHSAVHAEPVRVAAAPSITPVATPSHVPSARPSSTPRPTASPAKPTPKPKTSPKPSAKPAPSLSAISRATHAPGRPVQVASLPRQENNSAQQPLGQVPLRQPAPAATPAPPTFPPTPSPVPTAAPQRLEDARILRAVSPEEVDAERAGVSLPATVVVDVTVDANGHATSVRTEHSSGSMFLDQAALAAARASAYVPAKINGKPTTGTFRAVYEFR